ncbi:MAG: hypothetical protein LAO76_27360 [Acidobacteriia bacterium]|nr:hypothetical protein [Terriglobia bacterium]
MIREDTARLVIIEHGDRAVDMDLAVESLKKDLVVLVQNLSAEQADHVMHQIAEKLGLSDALSLQAGMAGFHGHRHNISKYFMSVNKRTDYQFITPHSEGSSFVGMQLATFYCYENTTDGGETILMNVDDSSHAWRCVRERVMRGKLGNKPLARHEILRAKGLYQLNLPDDVLRDDDQILQEHETKIPGLTVVEVLAKPEPAYSAVLNRKVNVYWDSIDGADLDSVPEYARLLAQSGLLKEPPGGLELRQLDPEADRRIWHSGVRYTELFKCKITRKLAPGDLVIQNNMTWAHSASNWSPGSGTRKIAASFA